MHFGLKTEKHVVQVLRNSGCLVITDSSLDHRLKTDMQVVQMDGKDISPPVCIQITLAKGNESKIQKFLAVVAGKYCRFIYIEISGHRDPGEEELFNAGTIAKAIKKIISELLQGEWREDKGARNKIFHVHILNHSKNEYTHKIRRLA